MEDKPKRIEYSRTEDYIIFGVSINRKLKHYVVSDRNGELMIGKKFNKASDAMEAAIECVKEHTLIK